MAGSLTRRHRASQIMSSFQARVYEWMKDCFKKPDALLPEHRAFRFIEEALELVQAVGTSRAEVLRVVEYVYGRPAGQDAQEIGGVMVTLAGLATSRALILNDCADEELSRCVINLERIRAKDLTKPQRSPLPGFVNDAITKPEGTLPGVLAAAATSTAALRAATEARILSAAQGPNADAPSDAAGFHAWLTDAPVVKSTRAFQSESGDWYAIPLAQYEADVAAYRQAVEGSDEPSMLKFDEGCTGWRSCESNEGGDCATEEEWVITRYVAALNWLQGNLFQQYVDRETKEIRFRLHPNANNLVQKLKGDSLFGAALAADAAEKL
jgi:hypothetical protein